MIDAEDNKIRFWESVLAIEFSFIYIGKLTVFRTQLKKKKTLA